MDDLSDRFRAYALDLWGFGDSDRRGDGYSLDVYVALLRRFMDEMGIMRAPLVGHALGGVVALHLAMLMPERVEQVMAVSTPLVGSAMTRQLTGFSGNGNDVATRILGRRQVSMYPEVQMEATKADTSAIVSSVRAVVQTNLRDELHHIDVPLLFVHGRNDPLVQPPDESWLYDLEDNARAIYLEESRHFPMLDETNKFNRLLRQFLEVKDDLDSLELKEEWRRRTR